MVFTLFADGLRGRKSPGVGSYLVHGKSLTKRKPGLGGMDNCKKLNKLEV